MKAYIILSAFNLASISLFAQSKNQIITWFYDLPISKSPEKIKHAIQANESFIEYSPSQPKNLQVSSSTYRGKIIKPTLPKTGILDSAKIELVIGTLNSPEGYSGGMKWLRFEYFSSDTIYLNQLFDMACADLKTESQQQKPTGFRKKDQVVGEGEKFIYINDNSELRSCSVLRNRYTNGTQSFTVHYSESTD